MLGELSLCSPEGLCALYIWFHNSYDLVFQPWPCSVPTVAQALLIILCFLGFICFHKFLFMAHIFSSVFKVYSNLSLIYRSALSILFGRGFFFPRGRMWWVIQWTWFVSSFKTPVVHGSNWRPQNYPSCCSKVENCFPEVIVALVASSPCWLMKVFQIVWWKYWVYFVPSRCRCRHYKEGAPDRIFHLPWSFFLPVLSEYSKTFWSIWTCCKDQLLLSQV